MSVALEAMDVPADVTERPFNPSDVAGQKGVMSDVLNRRLEEADVKNSRVFVEKVSVGDSASSVQCKAFMGVFDALKRAGVAVDGYSYGQGLERFTATLSAGEISAVTAARSWVAVGDTTGESTEATLPEVDPEATVE